MGSPLRINADVDINGTVNIAGQTQFDWATGAWSDLTMVPIRLATNGYTLSTPAYGSFGVQRGRIAHASGAESEDRRAYVWDEESKNPRIRGTWYDKSVKTVHGPGLPAIQAGYVLGLRTNDPDGWNRAIVVRHDVVFGQDQIIQVGWWRWNASGLFIDSGDVGTFPGLTGLSRTYNVANAVRAGNVVTASGIVDATTGFSASLVAGHTYTASFPDATYNVTFVATNGTQWPQVAADDPGSGAGTVTDLDGVWPLNIDAFKEGSAAYVKAWRGLTPEPAWGDPAYNVVMRGPLDALGDPYPDRPGRKGFYVGHAGFTGMYAEWGNVDRSQ